MVDSSLFQPFIYVCIGVEPLLNSTYSCGRQGWRMIDCLYQTVFRWLSSGFPHTYHSQIHVTALTRWQQAELEILPFSTFLPPTDTNTDRILGLWRVFPGWILLVCGGFFFILAISDVLSQIRQPNGGRQWWWWWNVSSQGSFCFQLDLSDRRVEKTGNKKGAERMN